MPDSLEKQLRTIINEYSKVAFDKTQEALAETAEEVVTIMERNSPVGGSAPGFKTQWEAQNYANQSYIGNKKQAANGIPLINILEGKSKLVSNTWERNKANIQSSLIRKLESKL